MKLRGFWIYQLLVCLWESQTLKDFFLNLIIQKDRCRFATRNHPVHLICLFVCLYTCPIIWIGIFGVYLDFKHSSRPHCELPLWNDNCVKLFCDHPS